MGERSLLSRVFLAAAVLVLLAASSSQVPVAVAARQSLGPGRLVPASRPTTTESYVVVYRDTVTNVDAETDSNESRQGFTSDFRYHAAVKGFAARLTPEQVSALESDPNVAFLTRDLPVKAVGSVPLVGTDTVPTGVSRIGAATATTVRQASTVNVAVIDTGIDLTHPDLYAVNGTNCVRSASSAQDDNGHGTHVSGSIAAKNNGVGVVGVAPGTKLYAVKVLDSNGSGSYAQVICGIDWVTANAAQLNIKVASMSLGGGGSNDNNCGNTNADAFHKAICNSTAAGVTYVVAAGNSAVDFATSVPAAYPEALTVTAMSDSDGQPGGIGGDPTCRTGERDDSSASFSNFAGSALDANHTVAGPGVCIYSTWMGGTYNTISGTSMATPHVTGSVALCIGDGGTAGPCAGLSPAQIIQKIRTDASAHATPANGFVGDPVNGGTAARYFGYLVWDGTTTTPPSPTVPGAPSLNATGGNTTVSLSWSVPNNGGSPITGYKIYRGLAPGGETPLTSVGSTTTSYPDTGLTNGTTYYYKVSALNTVGEGAPSNEASATPQPAATKVNVTSPSGTSGYTVSPNFKALLVTVALLNDLRQAVPGASVSITISRNNFFYASVTGTTATDGTVTFRLNAPAGTYSTNVTQVTATGLTWDGFTPPNSFIKVK